MNPSHQVYWKELRLWLYPAGRVSRQFAMQAIPALGIIALLMVMMILSGEDEFPLAYFAPTIAATSGASMGMALALDSFAGERERHTLETALAAPITPRQLLWGKILAQVSVSTVSTIIMALLALIFLLIFAGDVLTRVMLVFIFPGVVVGGAFFGVFMILLANLASLRSPTVKATGPRFGAYMAIAFAVTVMPMFVTVFVVVFASMAAGLRPDPILAFGGGGVVMVVGAVGYAVYLVRAILRDTRADRFQINL